MSKPKASRAARGYGTSHQARRANVAPIVDAGGAACCRCGQQILPGQAWHLDHADNRNGYAGVSHAYCNLSAAGRKSAAKRATTTYQVRKAPTLWSRVWYEPIPDNVEVVGKRLG